MESMPPTRRKKINVAGQASASHAKGPAEHMMIDRSSPLAWKRSVQLDPTHVTAEKSFSASITLWKKFVREDITTSSAAGSLMLRLNLSNSAATTTRSAATA
jgi:hypothetical protein